MACRLTERHDRPQRRRHVPAYTVHHSSIHSRAVLGPQAPPARDNAAQPTQPVGGLKRGRRVRYEAVLDVWMSLAPTSPTSPASPNHGPNVVRRSLPHPVHRANRSGAPHLEAGVLEMPCSMAPSYAYLAPAARQPTRAPSYPDTMTDNALQRACHCQNTHPRITSAWSRAFQQAAPRLSSPRASISRRT